MMMIRPVTVLLTLAGLAVSCGELLLEEDPPDTPEAHFELFWQTFDQYYCFFDYKGVDWDSLYSVYRPRITSRTTEKELLWTIAPMMFHLKDGHAAIYTSSAIISYDGWKYQAPANFNPSIVMNRYVQSPIELGGVWTYGMLSSEIGYIHLSTFFSPDEAVYGHIDSILQILQDVRGLVFDVRNNSGGWIDQAVDIAGRFTDKKRLYGFRCWRNGPRHTDFSELYPFYVEPAGGQAFTKPVAVLTNRRCFSATENLVMAMQTLSHVTIIGDTTGGGSGSSHRYELSNGWTYRVPNQFDLTTDTTMFEGIGLVPDITVWNSQIDSSRDMILETAVQLLNGQTQ